LLNLSTLLLLAPGNCFERGEKVKVDSLKTQRFGISGLGVAPSGLKPAALKTAVANETSASDAFVSSSGASATALPDRQAQPEAPLQPPANPLAVVKLSVPTPAKAPNAMEGWLISGFAGAPISAPLTSAEPQPNLELALAQKIATLLSSAVTVETKPTLTPYIRPKGAANHPGVELHNHMLGVVDDKYFIEKTAGGSPRRLLQQVTTMFEQNLALREEAVPKMSETSLWKRFAKQLRNCSPPPSTPPSIAFIRPAIS
jgi:hypothetical protein